MIKNFYIFILFICSCQLSHVIKDHEIDKITALKHFSLISESFKSYEISELLKEHRGLVLFFWQNHCPCLRRYQSRIENLYQNYSKKGIYMAFVSSNTDENIIDTNEEYQKRNLALPIFKDEDGKLAKATHVTGTPAALFISPEGEVLYVGWIDNERPEGEHGRKAYLQMALDEYLDGQKITAKTSAMFGCPIR